MPSVKAIIAYILSSINGSFLFSVVWKQFPHIIWPYLSTRIIRMPWFVSMIMFGCGCMSVCVQLKSMFQFLVCFTPCPPLPSFHLLLRTLPPWQSHFTIWQKQMIVTPSLYAVAATVTPVNNSTGKWLQRKVFHISTSLYTELFKCIHGSWSQSSDK